MKQTIADNLKETRTRAGRTQEQNACDTDIDRRRLSAFERGLASPTPQEREQLIESGHLDPEARHEERAARSYKTRWRQKRLTMYRKSDFPLEARISAAVKIFGPLATQRLMRLGDGEQHAAYMHFLSNAVVDSGLEMYAWLSLAASGAQPIWLSPASAGFRKWAVINPVNQEVLSDARFPAVEFQVSGVPAIAFPQITVSVRNSFYRMDALVGLRLGNKRVWLDLEIDGAGHDGTFDAEREERLGLVTVRVCKAELLENDLLCLLERKLEALKILKSVG